MLEKEKATALLDDKSSTPLTEPRPLAIITPPVVSIDNMKGVKILKHQSIDSIQVIIVNQNYSHNQEFINNFKVLIQECGSKILENMAFVSP